MAGNNQPAATPRQQRRDSLPVRTSLPAWTARCVRRNTATTRVLLVEDQRLVRRALAELFAGVPDIDIADQVAGGVGVVPVVRDLRPDVVVIDVDLSSPHGLATVRELRARLPESRVLALAAASRPGAIRGVLDDGVLGALDKDASPEHLRDAVRRVAAGSHYIDPALAVAALCVTSNPLTTRELSVLRLAAGGASALEIAAELSLSCGTVRNYLSRAVSKTGARSRIDAIRIAREAAWF